MGQMEVRARVIEKVAMLTGRKSRIFGYMSSGDNVWKGAYIDAWSF